MDWKNQFNKTPYLLIFVLLTVLSLGLLTNVSSIPEPLDFIISLSTNSASIDIVDQNSFDITVSQISGRGDVSLSASNIPSGVVVSFNPTTEKLRKNQPTFISTMSIFVSPTATNGIYLIQITATGKDIEKSQIFELTVTGTPPPPSEDIVVAAAGDIACKPPNRNGKGAVETETLCAQRRTSDILISLNPTAVLTLGDNQYDRGELKNFIKSYDPTWGRVKEITHPSTGNHDNTDNGAESGYYQYFGSSAGDPDKFYYNFNIGSWNLIALNSNCDEGGGCGQGSPQALWLQNVLENDNSNCTLAYWHHPRFAPGSLDTGHGDHDELDEFWQLLYQYGTDVVLVGHNHIYERLGKQTPDQVSSSDGIRQFIVGTGGKSHAGSGITQPNTEAKNSDTFGVLKLVLHEDSYDWQFIPEEGKTFTDTGSEPCNLN